MSNRTLINARNAQREAAGIRAEALSSQITAMKAMQHGSGQYAAALELQKAIKGGAIGTSNIGVVPAMLNGIIKGYKDQAMQDLKSNSPAWQTAVNQYNQTGQIDPLYADYIKGMNTSPGQLNSAQGPALINQMEKNGSDSSFFKFMDNVAVPVVQAGVSAAVGGSLLSDMYGAATSGGVAADMGTATSGAVNAGSGAGYQSATDAAINAGLSDTPGAIGSTALSNAGVDTSLFNGVGADGANLLTGSIPAATNSLASLTSLPFGGMTNTGSTPPLAPPPAVTPPPASSGAAGSDVVASGTGAGTGNALAAGAVSGAGTAGGNTLASLTGLTNGQLGLGAAQVGAGIYGANQSANAAQSAADTSAAATNASTALQSKMFDQNQANMQSWLDAGKSALTSQQELLSNPSSYQQSPYNAWLQQQGMDSLNASAAAKGNLNSGNTLASLIKYGQGMAGQGFNDQFNRYGSLSGTGNSTANQMANQSTQYANNVGNLNMANANTQGNATLSGANSQNQMIGNSLNSLSNLYGQGQQNNYNQQLLNTFQSGSNY